VRAKAKNRAFMHTRKRRIAPPVSKSRARTARKVAFSVLAGDG
jgi:hypothetical protein